MAKKILIVDDSEITRTMIRDRLEAANYEVVEAEDGEQGLVMAEAEQPDLVLLDRIMPKLEGTEVCRRLKADEKLEKIPIFFVSVKAEEKDIKAGLAAGADGYITKPYEGQELVSTIEKVLGERKNS
ncbi:MAG: response regulator [bacterium]|nr:response regulator [Candidatus Margulisiibacteriota bacterium]